MEQEALIAFVKAHAEEDPMQLLLRQHQYPDVDMRLVAQQLEGHKQALAKWPTLAHYESYLYPPKLNREQSSSEATARYKANLLVCDTLADLTGGMGVDTYFFSRCCQQVDYIEMQPELHALATQNFQTLGCNNIKCHSLDGIEWVRASGHTDTLYIDPARRDTHGRKVSAFEDCTPNLLEHLVTFLQHSRRVVVKASPMIDLELAQQQLGRVVEIHIVAVENECKEILFTVESQQESSIPEEATIHCVNLTHTGDILHHNSFTLRAEQEADATYCSIVKRYLYEPNAALMKGGCYHSICQWYGVEKLARNTHLYTSEERIDTFPGRTFEVLQGIALNKKSVQQLLPAKRAHVTTRNYPMAAAELQRKLGLREGGELFIVAATLGSKPKGWLCRQIAGDLR